MIYHWKALHTAVTAIFLDLQRQQQQQQCFILLLIVKTHLRRKLQTLQ